MTDPYAAVAEYYDIMVDWPSRLARERPFFAQLLMERPARRALDVGCGTGHHTRMLAEFGAETIGIDPSAPMLARARQLTSGEHPQFIAGGFAEIPAMPGPFDLITILGNTLAYVRDGRELRRTLRACREKLTPGGRLCLQVVNYDSLLAQGDRWLPVVSRTRDGRNLLFLREYRCRRTRVEFTLITLHQAPGWQQLTERSTHYPITADRLHRALRAAGFTTITSYGDYQGAPFTPETSPSLIVLAE